MTPHYSDDWLTVYLGDCRAVMAEMEPESVHCVVTSPPYWGLRDYGEPGQLGLEPTPEAYVENMVAVFREVRRVLRSDGTVWLNLGDSYASGTIGRNDDDSMPRPRGGHVVGSSSPGRQGSRPRPLGMKPKDLVGIPWRVAFALQVDGWYLRSDIIWSKLNPMPESVTDRPTKSHEYLFLLSKSPRYYFDADAVREPNSPDYRDADRVAERRSIKYDPTLEENRTKGGLMEGNPMRWSGHGRNIRSVWTVATQPYPGAHFATFPPKLIEPCIKAGTSERGVCPECGAPWEREVERTGLRDLRVGDTAPKHLARTEMGLRSAKSGLGGSNSHDASTPQSPAVTTIGWTRTCAHDALPVPATVLDCFAGSGTTGMVAQSLSRRAVLIDLSADYLGQVMDRNRDIPLGLGA